MIKTSLRHTCAGFALAMGLAAAPAYAQVGTAANDDSPPQAEPEIIVTGTLIRGNTEDQPAPIDVISSEELAKQGSPSVIDLIKNLPTSNGIIGDANQFDARAQGNEGVASVNLRGLGPQRTLVLLNGRRIVPSGGSGIPIVDVNLIPSAAIGRIEVLKDGAAATYGSDAIGGVVNFITKTNQDGFLVSGDYRYIEGSKGDYGGAVSFGKDVDGLRFFVSAGYQRRSELQTLDRDFVIQPYPNNPQGGWTGGGNPGNFDFNGPFVGGNVFSADQGCVALGGFRSLPGSTTDRCFNQYGLFGNLVEPEERFQFFGDVEFDIGSSSKLRFNALWGHSETQITTSPSYLPTLPPSGYAANGLTSIPAGGITTPAQAAGLGLFVIPAYSPALRDYCALYGATAGCAPGQPATAFPVLFRPALLGGNPLFFGDNERGSATSPRISDEVLLSAEFRTELTPSLDLTVSGTYSQYDRFFGGTDTFGDLFQNALAGFGGACAYASPQSRAGLTAAQLAALAGTNGCTFYNPFSTAIQVNAATGETNPNYAGTRNPAGFNLTPGAGLINDLGTIDNFFQDTGTRAITEQIVADVVLSGQTGITLPGGGIGFAIGGQYRKNDYQRRYNYVSNLDFFPCPGSALTTGAICSQQTGALGFLGTNRNGSSSGDIWAAFGELQLPVTDRIQVQLAARFEDYGGNVGSTFDPQGRVKFQVTDWLALRAGAGTTFRGPPSQQLAGNLTSLQIIGSSFRAIDVGGNPNLAPESATTYNAGVIVDTGAFKATVDYFRYDLDGPIEGEPVQGIVNALFGATGSANCNNPEYAALQSRFTFTAAGCGIGNVQRLRTQIVNSSKIRTSGIDFQTSYSLPFAGDGSITAGVAGTYVIEYKTSDVTVEGILVQPAFDAVGLLNYQTTAYPLPEWKGNAFLQADFGRQSLRAQVNYIDGYTDQRGAAIFGPNPGALAGASVTTGKEIKPFTTVDLTYRLTLPTDTTLAVSLQNILDEDPPFARLDQNYDPFTATPLGFTAKVAISQAF
ncbi:TonB-dependent receptor domain-containing protein [Tsuneonella amylolytica]|uniref:TonB-dependent receptor domain-containing protein n=1 Tax=Tsuneonella amylolytica TaxID=2338327 RepID=UPI0013C403AA|nr:TonB-dependent receptor [Tsuneonella amylolytica]